MAVQVAEAAEQLKTAGELLHKEFSSTFSATTKLSEIVSQQALENRQAIAAVGEINDATAKINQALLEQSKVSDGILATIEQIREIAKNHADAAQKMGEVTQQLAQKSEQLKEEVAEFKV